jgi:hypothetical protein
MTPVYDGKGQPPTEPGWFGGLAAWWNRLTPTYVTVPSRSAGTVSRNYISSTTTARPSKRPSGASGKATTSPSAQPVTTSSTPATKP